MVEDRRSGALLVASFQRLPIDPAEMPSPSSGSSTISSTSVPQATRPVTNASTPSSTSSNGQYGQSVPQIDQGSSSRLLQSSRTPIVSRISGPTTWRARRGRPSGGQPSDL